MEVNNNTPFSPWNQAQGQSNSSTIILPSGTTNHGEPNIICLPAKWTDISEFILGNYVAHAATIVYQQGSSSSVILCMMFATIFFPGGAWINIKFNTE